MKKRNKTPIPGSLGKLQERSIFKNRRTDALRNAWRPGIRSTQKPLVVDYSHR